MITQARIHFYALRSLDLLQAVSASVYRRRWFWIAGLLALFWFVNHYKLGINASRSLPEHVYLIDKKDHALGRGEYVSFRWHGGGPYQQGVSFTKIVAGLPGDVVTIVDRRIYINGEYLSTAKERATTGQLLHIGPAGVIPPSHYYVHATNPDSLDSRYAITGWISAQQVTGKARPLF